MSQPNQYIVIGEIVLILVVVSALSFFAWNFFKKRRDKVETAGAGEVGKDLQDKVDKDLLSSVKAIKEKQIADAKKMNVILIGDLIYDAKQTFGNDDEEAVYSAFALIPNKFALSLFSDYWKGAYKIDLFTFLRSFLDDSELNKINAIISKLK